MNNEKINSFGLASLVIPLSSASFYGIFSSYILNTSKTSTLLSMVIGYVLSLLISMIILGIFSAKPDFTFAKKFKFAYKKLSIPINVLFTLASLMVYILFTYRLTSFLSNQYLIETSNVSILILVLLLTFYTASKGIETTCRVSIISLFLAGAIYLFDVFSLLKYIDFNNYLPIITTGKSEIIKSSIIFAFYFSVPVFYINAVKKNDLVDKEKFNKKFLIMHFASFCMTFTSIAITLGTYGINVVNIFDYPLYTVLKKISLFNFLDSLENISIMLWLLNIINACNIILLFIFNNIKETFNLKNKTSKKLNFLILLVSFLVPAIFFINNTYVDSFKYINLPFITTIFILIVSLITLIIIKCKKSKS